MSYTHPYAPYSNQSNAWPNNNAQPAPSCDVRSWLDVALAFQEHGWDPAIYSDPVGTSSQYVQTSYMQQYPRHQSMASQSQYSMQAYPPPMQRSNSYPPAFQQPSTSFIPNQPAPTYEALYSHYSSPEAFVEEDFSSVSSSPPPTDPESPRSIARAKSKIALAPTQPLTAEGRPRERVFVACDRCRVRKLRCDGGKPECVNCQRAPEEECAVCRYDPTPRRRGQDKAPRTRSAVGHRKPRRPAVRKGDPLSRSRDPYGAEGPAK